MSDAATNLADLNQARRFIERLLQIVARRAPDADKAELYREAQETFGAIDRTCDFLLRSPNAERTT